MVANIQQQQQQQGHIESNKDDAYGLQYLQQIKKPLSGNGFKKRQSITKDDSIDNVKKTIHDSILAPQNTIFGRKKSWVDQLVDDNIMMASTSSNSGGNTTTSNNSNGNNNNGLHMPIGVSPSIFRPVNYNNNVYDNVGNQVKFVNSTVEHLQNQIKKEEAPKKKRTRTTPEQLRILQKTFQVDKMPNSAARQILAKKLGMNARAVQVWFQNRRAKRKLELRRAPNSNHHVMDEIHYHHPHMMPHNSFHHQYHPQHQNSSLYMDECINSNKPNNTNTNGSIVDVGEYDCYGTTGFPIDYGSRSLMMKRERDPLLDLALGEPPNHNHQYHHLNLIHHPNHHLQQQMPYYGEKYGDEDELETDNEEGQDDEDEDDEEEEEDNEVDEEASNNDMIYYGGRSRSYSMPSGFSPQQLQALDQIGLPAMYQQPNRQPTSNYSVSAPSITSNGSPAAALALASINEDDAFTNLSSRSRSASFSTSPSTTNAMLLQQFNITQHHQPIRKDIMMDFSQQYNTNLHEPQSLRKEIMVDFNELHSFLTDQAVQHQQHQVEHDNNCNI